MKTALYDRHVALGAKIVPFAGWEMPIQYKGIIHEHTAVRKAVGVFDVSHMGRVDVEGPDAEQFLEYVTTNHLASKVDGSVIYTVLTNDHGGCVDDLLIFRITATHFLVVVNAGNRQKDLEHLQLLSSPFNVTITPHYDGEGILAIQGPGALEIVGNLFPEAAALKYMHFTQVRSGKDKIVLSRTGYTGSMGFEVYAHDLFICDLWDRLMKAGVEPIGLGARDTLRLEMGYALYGHELSDTIAPSESVSAWTVKLHGKAGTGAVKGGFIGKEAIQKLQGQRHKRSQVAVVLLDPGVAREGYEVFDGERLIGKVTSGTHSPSLNKAIALICVEGNPAEGAKVSIQVRGRKLQAQVVKLPFVKSAVI